LPGTRPGRSPRSLACRFGSGSWRYGLAPLARRADARVSGACALAAAGTPSSRRELQCSRLGERRTCNALRNEPSAGRSRDSPHLALTSLLCNSPASPQDVGWLVASPTPFRGEPSRPFLGLMTLFCVADTGKAHHPNDDVPKLEAASTVLRPACHSCGRDS